MKRRFIWLTVGAFLAIVAVLSYLGAQGTMSVLAPAGPIASQQRHIIVWATLLSLLVVVPVFALTIFIAWRYRASNHKADYRPDWDGSRTLETLWWLIPSLLIAGLAVVAWRTSHSLDPGVAISSSQKPLYVQVVALDWKWLFIYPEQGVASVNRLEIPTGRPLSFSITADAPMNSFWIPQLGGQIYAMPGMSTHLNLLADKPGNFRGSSANISGSGFSSMVFNARATSPDSFDSWVDKTKQGDDQLSLAAYQELAKPGTTKPHTYHNVSDGLYNRIVNKYMSGHSHMTEAEL